jgi:hypothetical protein
MNIIIYRTVCLLFVAALTGSCASVDQYGARAYDGNVNTQDAFNKEVLANIVRASQYQALSWNPPSQITGGQSESLATALPTITTGPHQMAPYIYSITNSLTSGVSGGFTTAPLATTSFQAGMLTPVDLKTIASLATYYPREAIFYSLIAAIDLKTESTPSKYARLINDPSLAYFDIRHPNDLDQSQCNSIIQSAKRKLNKSDVFFKASLDDSTHQCSYEKFLNLLSVLVQAGLYTELVQIPAQQPAQAQANQSNIVTVGGFCFNKNLAAGNLVQSTDFRPCGLDKKQNVGGTIVSSNAVTNKSDDRVVNTNIESATKTTTTTTTSILPVTGHNFRVEFTGIGWVDITFEMRSPNGFLSYLGSWLKFGDKVPFQRYERDDSGELKLVPYYDTVQAQQIFNDGPYLSILNINGPSVSCYSSVTYEGQTYCVPSGATHTSMLMDIAIILRNLNITPADLNAPVSVRVAD